MTILIEKGDILDIPCDLLVVNLFKGVTDPGGAMGAVDEAMQGDLSKLIKQDEFEGALGQRMTVPTFGRVKAKKICVLGLGDRKEFSSDTIRQIGGYIVKAAKEAKAKRVVTILHGAGIAGLDSATVAEALTQGIQLGSYEFREHLGTATKSKKRFEFQEVRIMEPDRVNVRHALQGAARAEDLTRAVKLVRHMVNTSPRHMKPMDLVEESKKILTRGSGITCKVYHREDMQRMGMGAALAVGEGSVHPPVCVHLTYKPKKRVKQVVALVGKGVTFDSGGLSLKPADSMINMKIDMGGAATVIGIMSALPSLNLPIEVHGIFIAVENMPSGGSYRPGDVVTAMNGMTIEILNTDAEGRVTMADSLSYAMKRVKPDTIIDFATLTGAAIVALGDDYVCAMGNDRKLTQSVLKSAKETGEYFWELPLPKQYEDSLKSKVADMNNTGGRQAGAIKGGLFLKKFVGDTSWLHLDIAGPVFCEKEHRPDVPYGGTGVGVRTIVKWLEGLA